MTIEKLSSEDKQFKTVKARFNPDPRYADTLVEGAQEFKGKVLTLSYAWIADDGEMFNGTWILQIVPGTEHSDELLKLGVVTVPEFDLDIIEYL